MARTWQRGWQSLGRVVGAVVTVATALLIVGVYLVGVFTLHQRPLPSPTRGEIRATLGGMLRVVGAVGWVLTCATWRPRRGYPFVISK